MGRASRNETVIGRGGDRPGGGLHLSLGLGLGVGLSVIQLAACAAPGVAPDRTVGGMAARAYNRPYQVRGRWYAPADQPGYDAVGLASWYDYPSQSRTTANGEPFDARLATAAHTTLPIPSYLDVTNLQNGRTLRVRLNDRGPFVADRILDLSRGAALALGFLAQGTTRVRVRYAGPAPSRAGPTLMLARVAAPDRLSGPLAGPLAGPLSGSSSALPAAAASPFVEGAASIAPEAPTPSGYDVQVAAFADPANAERAASRLATIGQMTGGQSNGGQWTGAPAIRALDRDGRRLYRVVLGPWRDAGSADSARAGAAALGYDGARVVRAD